MQFTLPCELDEDIIRETFLYMTLRSIMIKTMIDNDVEHKTVRALIEKQDEIWEEIGGSVAEGWE